MGQLFIGTSKIPKEIEAEVYKTPIEKQLAFNQ
jgi:hypothetical protein